MINFLKEVNIHQKVSLMNNVIKNYYFIYIYHLFKNNLNNDYFNKIIFIKIL